MLPVKINGEGPHQAKIVIVGEAPGKEETEHGRPFVGSSGRILDKYLHEAGIFRSECYITNVVKYQPPENNIKRVLEIGVSLSESIDELKAEIKAIKPNVIVALGNVALEALTDKSGITNWRGSLLISNVGPKLIPSFHPSYLLRSRGGDAYLWHVAKIDWQRIVRESRTGAYNVSKRSLNICKSSLDLFRFLRESRGDYLSIDIEAFKCIPNCVGLSNHPSLALSVPLFDYLNGVKMSDMPMKEIMECWRMLSRALTDPKWKKIGQNFKYDEQKLGMIGLQIDRLYADTMIRQHTLYPEMPQSLAFQTSVWTEESYYKDDGKEFNPRKDKIDQLLIYNARDAAVTLEIFLAQEKELEEVGLKSFYYDFVHRNHYLYFDMEPFGFCQDLHQKRILNAKYSAKWEEFQTRLNSLVGWDINVASPKQVGKYIYEQCKFKAKWDRRENRWTYPTDEDTIVDILTYHAKDLQVREALNLIIDTRRVRKTLGTYLECEGDYDGKIRWTHRVTGTETGRSSTAMLKPPLRPTKSGLSFHTLTKHGDIGSDVRSFLLPDEGKVLVNTDLSQAEARIVAILARDEDTLKLFDVADIHRITAGMLFNMVPGITTVQDALKNIQRVVDQVKSVNGDQRFVGKFGRHAGNYGMRENRLRKELQTNARKFGIKIGIVSKWRAEEIIRIFNAFTPKTKEVFQAEVIEYVKEFGYLVNPFGRKRIIFGRDDDEFGEWFAQIPQSTVPDHLRDATFRIKDRLQGIEIIAEGHDALLLQCRPNEIAEVARVQHEEFMRPIDFSQCSLPRGSLIIPCTTEFGDNYKDMEEYKVELAKAG